MGVVMRRPLSADDSFRVSLEIAGGQKTVKIFYPDGCDQIWRQSLTPWQIETLVALHRQGRHLRDGTNHGSDQRWCQAGVKTRDTHYGWGRRTRRDDSQAHEAIVIQRKPYGFAVIGIRHETVFTIDPESGAMTSHLGWQPCSWWFVGPESSGSPEKVILERVAT